MPGSGNSKLAEILAQSWLCTNKETPGCGECRACQSWARHSNADVLTIAPAGPSQNIRVNAIVPSDPDQSGEPAPLSLHEFFRTMPLTSANKVAIIHEAENLLPRAANALLKTLEEPQQYGKLILTSNSVGHVLPTILSRCVAVACELPHPEERADAALGPLDWLFAEGSPGRAAEIAGSREVYAELDRFARGLPNRAPAEALVAADEFRAIVDKLESARGCGVRQANAGALEALALAFERAETVPSKAVKLVAEAHRRVVGNGNATMALDSLFSGLLLEAAR
jgi:DNA polymerase III subunit delta'